jgi:hypothetical protein
VPAVRKNFLSRNIPNGDAPLFFSEQLHQRHSYNTRYLKKKIKTKKQKNKNKEE